MEETGAQSWSRKIPRAVEQLSVCPATAESVRHSYWSLLTTEPGLCNESSHHSGETGHHSQSSPLSLHLEKKPMRPWRSRTVWVNKIIFKKGITKNILFA